MKISSRVYTNNLTNMTHRVHHLHLKIPTVPAALENKPQSARERRHDRPETDRLNQSSTVTPSSARQSENFEAENLRLSKKLKKLEELVLEYQSNEKYYNEAIQVLSDALKEKKEEVSKVNDSLILCKDYIQALENKLGKYKKSIAHYKGCYKRLIESSKKPSDEKEYSSLQIKNHLLHYTSLFLDTLARFPDIQRVFRSRMYCSKEFKRLIDRGEYIESTLELMQFFCELFDKYSDKFRGDKFIATNSDKFDMGYSQQNEVDRHSSSVGLNSSRYHATKVDHETERILEESEHLLKTLNLHNSRLANINHKMSLRLNTASPHSVHMLSKDSARPQR
jgi:hypothetical protein